MKIGIVATHSWPVPTPVHTGDVVILDLAIALTELGHEVVMFAPSGTKAPRKLCEMPASLGASTPSAYECEVACWNAHRSALLSCDIIHDFSIEKNIAERTMADDRPAISTLLGGNYDRPRNGRNACVWSSAMRGRALKGQTDYWGTPTPDLAGPPTQSLADAHVVYGGVDTEFYCPSNEAKGSHYLWLNRWHPVKGFRQAIQLAKETGIELVMAGEHPDNMRWDSEKAFAWEAQALAKGHDNIDFWWLPGEDEAHHIQKRDFYRHARALLYPVQFQEPFGLSMVEAMACGTPVIGNNLGSVPELISGTGTVCEIAVDWHYALADDGKRLVSWDGHLASPDDCRAEAVTRFSRKAMAERYLVEYQAVLDGKGWGGR